MLKTTLITFSAATLLSLAGCSMTTMKAEKSSLGHDITPLTGSAAQAAADHMATAQGGEGAGKRAPNLEPVALFPGPAMPIGIALSHDGRTFMCFPRWMDAVKNTVVELKDGRLIPFPDEATNAFDAKNLAKTPPQDHFVSPQAIVFDQKDRLWVLDPGCLNFGPSLKDAPKLWAYDISTRQVLQKITFPTDVAGKMTALNDVRFDLHRGDQGTAYITDSGIGGIIVVDLATGSSWRHLDNHPSVLPQPGLHQFTEGQPLLMRKKNGEVDAPNFHSDGIALSPDGKTLYYNAIVSHNIYAISTDLLAQDVDEARTWAGVKKIATKPSGNDGLLCGPDGTIYTTDFESNAIRKVDPRTSDVSLVAQDERLLWPDTLAFHDGYLYVTTNQLARQPNYHFGQDQRQPPYALFRIKVAP